MLFMKECSKMSSCSGNLWLHCTRMHDATMTGILFIKMGLRVEQVAAALKERAQRVYDQYGNVMLDVAGMTKAGIERKATCRALFSKILFLAGLCLYGCCLLRPGK